MARAKPDADFEELERLGMNHERDACDLVLDHAELLGYGRLTSVQGKAEHKRWKQIVRDRSHATDADNRLLADVVRILRNGHDYLQAAFEIACAYEMLSDHIADDESEAAWQALSPEAKAEIEAKKKRVRLAEAEKKAESILKGAMTCLTRHKYDAAVGHLRGIINGSSYTGTLAREKANQLMKELRDRGQVPLSPRQLRNARKAAEKDLIRLWKGE